MNESRVVIFGAGGHASVLADTLTRNTRQIDAVISPEPVVGPILQGVTRFERDEDIRRFDPLHCQLVMGLGPKVKGDIRPRIVAMVKQLGFNFADVISSTAYVAQHVSAGEGVQFLPSCVVNTGAEIAEHVVVNTRAVVEHDCRVGAFSHIAPGAVLCGGVHVGEHVFVGAGAVILPGVTIASHTVIGANALVDKDITEPCIVFGARATVQQRSSI